METGTAFAHGIEAELRQRSPAHMLPGRYYFDEKIYRMELDRIWYRDWLFVAHAAEIPNVGDFITTMVGDHPIVLVRGEDGVVRALNNVCRHRGSTVCQETRGHARRLVCPYHQWSYRLDGSLVNARSTGEDFDPEGHGLAPARCEETAGMLFVSLANEDGPSFSPMKDLVDGYMAPFEPERAKVAAVSVTVESGNWKIVMENNRECYHCRGGHPELSVSFPEEPLHTGGHSSEDAASLERLVALGESYGLPSKYIASPDNQFRAMRMPFKGDTRSMTMTGQPAVSQRFGSLPDVNLGDVLLYHYPTSWSHFQADHIVTARIMPLSATTTQLTTTWLVPEGAIEGVDYDVSTLTEVWNITNKQDAAFIEAVQTGVQSPRFEPGPYAPIDEAGVIEFVDWYSTQMLSRSE